LTATVRDEISVRVSLARRRLAVVFADLSGFVEYTAAHGDHAAAQLVTTNVLTAMAIVVGHQGRIVKYLGDGLLACFIEPRDAVIAAVELVGAASDVLPMRAAADWGDVVTTGADVVGHHVNVAARLVDEAHPGEVLVTEALIDAAGAAGVAYGGVTCRAVKGVREPVRVASMRRA